jgi:GNAT superfamily N-acetyltransferase
MSNLKYQIITPNDNEFHNGLLETASEIHQREKDTSEWLKWKYFSSPFGNCIVACAINEQNKVVGEISFGRYEFILNNETVKAAYSYQTMVHPDYQGKGVFKKLTNLAINECKNQGVEILFNFPNANSYMPFIKNKWKPINSIKYWMKPMRFLKVLANITSIRKSFQVDNAISLDEINVQKLKELFYNVKPLNIPNTLCPNRTKEFLEWRYTSYPVAKYKSVINDRIAVIVRTGTRGKLKEVQIMEAFEIIANSFNKDEIKRIEEQIKNELNADLITFNITEAHPLNNILKSTRFISMPHSIKFCIYPLVEKFNSYTNKDNWIITATEFHRY